ncbi:TetR/AcrR family transcriptional regulator [Spongiactinospora sp. 9N601]|uniref:TetR/AcrR family transcriptional regulator n=1 Tax=Spongiactinospora sp. 9N601 TaxID=3375149 RepID=UPI0037B7851A
MAPERPRRADARRNYDRIVAAAEAEIARHGADASLEEIARRAGVGSATLHRHFPSRQALLEAVFHDRVEVLCAQAREMRERPDAADALSEWLQAVAVYGATTRGLARSLLGGWRETDPPPGSTCEAMLVDAGAELLLRATDAEAVRPDVSIIDLLTLVNAISLATEGTPNAADEAARLLRLTIEGVRTPGP